MGLFDKLKSGLPVDKTSKDSKSSKGKPKKEKKSKRGKGQKGLIESMGLNEAVASMGLSTLEQVANSNDPSAVRDLTDGYTVILITEDMLQEQNFDPKSADFGSFANAISSEYIQSILLRNDLENGILAIIPDRDTLDVLDEFSMLQDLVYTWGIVPHDADDDSTVIQLQNGATLGDLNVIADEDLQLAVRNGMIVTADEADDDNDDESFDDDTDDFDFDDESGISGDFDDDDDDDSWGSSDFDNDDHDLSPDLDIDIDDDVELFSDDDDDDFNAPDPDFIDDDDDFDGDLLYGDDVGDDQDSFSDFDDDYENDDAYDESDHNDVYEMQSEDEGREMIQGVLSRTFQNDELGVVIPADPFNHQFGDVKPILFEEKATDNSSLARVVAQMRRDANVEIMNLHNAHMQSLRSHYQNGLAGVHDLLLKNLNYKDSDTAVGRKYIEINEHKEEKESFADSLIANNKETLNDEYESARESFGERARQEALAKYDDEHKSEHERKISQLSDNVYQQIQLEYDADVSNLWDDRRQLARRLFDKMTTQLLLELQTLFAEKMAQEHLLYDKFRQEIDAYARDNYSDEVLRAKALADQQRQHHEAEAVRAEYEQMLTAKQRQLEEAERKANKRIREMQDTHSQTVKDSIADYTRQIERQNRDNKDLREDLRHAQDRLAAVTKETEAEYQHRMNTLNDTIESQRKQLEYEQERTSKQTKQNGLLLGGMVIVGVALGLIGGFLVGTSNSSDNTQQQAPQSTIMHVPVQTVQPQAVLNQDTNVNESDQSVIDETDENSDSKDVEQTSAAGAATLKGGATSETSDKE